MQRVKPRTLSGFMELLPEKQAKMERFQEILKSTYSLYGFTALDTPIIEASEVLLAKAGGETENQIYRFTKGDTDLSLRFDLTVPLAKYVAANYSQLAFPFRRYQIGKVYRGERAQRGRFREFYQADIDIIGDGALGIMNEAEIPAIIYQTFTALGLKRFKIRVNNRKVLNGFFAILGLSDTASEVMHVIDKLDKIGHEECRALLTKLGLSSSSVDELMDFISISGTASEKLSTLSKYSEKNETFDEGLKELSAVCAYLPEFGVSSENFEIDLTIARGLDYYTGTVYETTLIDYPEIGSICSGGRYDDLAGYYTNKKLPGVGISIGLTRLFYILDEQGLLSEDTVTSSCDAIIIPMTEDLSSAIKTATYFRSAGIRTQLYIEEKKFKAKVSYADKIGAPFAVFIGEDEISGGLVKVKNMLTGEQSALSAENAAQLIVGDAKKRRSATLIKEASN